MRKTNAPTAEQNYNRQILNNFIEQKAVNGQGSISFEEIRVPFSDEVKTLYLKHLIKDQFIIVNHDQTMWFNQSKWDQTVKRLSRIYLAILTVPIVIIAGLAYLLSQG